MRCAATLLVLIAGCDGSSVSTDPDQPDPEVIHDPPVELLWADESGALDTEVPPSTSSRAVVYVHGYWQGSQMPPDLFSISTATRADLSEGWRARGDRIGVFRWHRLNMEFEITHAEAKIYTRDGPRGMRYLDGDPHGERDFVDADLLPVKDLLREALDSAIDLDSEELWLVGHSLGSGLTLAVARELADAGRPPARVVILDPYFSKGAKAFLGGLAPAELAIETSALLRESGVYLEIYKSSDFHFFVGDSAETLRQSNILVRHRPHYTSDIVEKHNAAVDYFFGGVEHQRVICGESDEVPGPTSDTSFLADIDGGVWFEHTEGRTTPDQTDDCYTLRRWAP